jgi:tetratricopeptide (TPR) repeat protein
MRTLLLSLTLIFGFVLPVSAEGESAAEPPAAADPEPDRASRLDTLFETLKSAADPAAAEAAENDIITLWLQSGSDTVDLLMQWTLAAIEERDYALALDYLDRMVIMKPDFAEAWNKRATVHFLLDDYSRAIADIERTLQLEPRHFGALSGLGAIMRDIGENDRAMAAYRRALEYDPHLENVRQALQEIEKETAGRDI